MEGFALRSIGNCIKTRVKFFIPKAYNNSVKIHKLLMLMVDGLVLFKKRGFKNGIKKIM